MNEHLTLVSIPLGSGAGEFWLSDAHKVSETDPNWQFCLCGAGKEFIARFVYRDEVGARRAAIALGAAIQNATFISTTEAP